MSDRDGLIDAGATALVRDGLDALFSMSAQVMSARVLDAVEPLIRADERVQALLDGEDPSSAWHLEYLQDQANTLRAKVMALTMWMVERRTAPMAPKDRVVAVLLSDVLALLDGSSDE